MLVSDLLARLAGEDRTPGEEMIEQRAQGVNVSVGAYLPAERLLRRAGISDGVEVVPLRVLAQRVEQRADAEIGDQQPTIALDVDPVGGEVAVHHAALMGVLQRRRELVEIAANGQ